MDLREAVISALGPLVGERGFGIAEADAHSVLLASPRLHMHVVHDPRGEVEVRVFRPARPTEGIWTYSGMTGRATVERFLELAKERLLEDGRILAGDDGFYDGLAADQESERRRWNEYYQGEGPQPRGRLP